MALCGLLASASALAVPAAERLASADNGPALPALSVEVQSALRAGEGLAPALSSDRRPQWQQVMVWRTQGRYEVGMGLAVSNLRIGMDGRVLGDRAGASGSGLGGASSISPNIGRLLVGAGGRLTPGVTWRMGLSLPVGRTTGADVGAEPSPDEAAWVNPRKPLVGLSLTARRPMAEFGRGLQMRMELSQGTTLSIKPRRSRVLLELHSVW